MANGRPGRGPARNRPPRDPVVILIVWTGHMIAAAWLAVAGAVGFAARAVGRGARDLDPHHKRDGVGLLSVVTAILLGVGLWIPMTNMVGRSIHTAAVDAFGSLDFMIPVLAALLAWRFLRHPDRNSETIRAAIGWTALLLGALGIIHIAKGTPHPSDGTHAIRAACGYLGYAVSGPLAAALTPWTAAPLLAFVAAYGVLLISGTPLHRLPERFADIRGMFGHDRPRPESGDDGLAIDQNNEVGTGAVRRAPGQLARQIRLRPAIEPGEHVKPYDTSLVEQDNKRGGKPRPDGGDGLIEALGFGADEPHRVASAPEAAPRPLPPVPPAPVPLRSPERLTLIAGDAVTVQGHAFLSYVREDSNKVDWLQQLLETAGIQVWRDTTNLWPGEDWRARIRQAITQDALVFIACFSQHSTYRHISYMNEELILAVEQLRLRRPDEPWLIPIRLDNCVIPEINLGGGRTLSSIQYADLFGENPDKGAQRLVT